jgi:protein gp37
MSTKIEWTQRPHTKGETWNPVVGCTKVSQGCKNCYAKTIHDNRHKAYSEGKLQNVKQYAVPFEHVQLMPERLTMPLKWKSPRTIFVNSVSDLFHESVPFSYIDQVFAVMALTPQHTYQILTKRPERMAEYFRTGRPNRLEEICSIWHHLSGQPAEVSEWPLPNVWLGTSVEDQATADARIPYLLRCPAAVRFLSCEPLLGEVDLKNIAGGGGSRYQVLAPIPGHRPSIDWVIVGGESGSKARPMHPDWARSLRDQCKAAGVPFFFKQWGEWCPATEEYGVTGHVMPESNPKYTWIGGDGTLQAPSAHGLKEPIMAIARQGKQRAGRVLDGVEHSEWPSVSTTVHTTEPA